MQHQKAAYNLIQLVKAVEASFECLEPIILRFVWITLKACKIEVMKKKGGIDYHIPRMRKTKLAREDRLLMYLTINEELIYEH